MLFINKLKNSDTINKELLKLIDNSDKYHFETKKENISYTDWNCSNKNRTYFKFLVEHLKPIMTSIANELYSYDWNIDHYWFQQYYKNDYHSWHTHIKTQFTNIYYVELPELSMATEIYKHKKLTLKEGNLLTFPSWWYHRSIVNNTDKRKTIISFNSNFQNFKQEEK